MKEKINLVFLAPGNSVHSYKWMYKAVKAPRDTKAAERLALFNLDALPRRPVELARRKRVGGEGEVETGAARSRVAQQPCELVQRVERTARVRHLHADDAGRGLAHCAALEDHGRRDARRVRVGGIAPAVGGRAARHPVGDGIAANLRGQLDAWAGGRFAAVLLRRARGDLRRVS